MVYKLVEAASKGNLSEVISLVKKGVELKHCIRLALIKASDNGHSVVIEYLMDKCEHYVPEGNGYPMFRASIYGHANVVKLFIDKGVNLSICGRIALQKSLELGHVEVAQLLIANGVSTDRVISF